MSETRKALHELIDLLREVDERYLGPEWNLNDDASVAEGARSVMHMLQGGLASHFEDDPDHPTFRKIVSPTRKFTGDNPDAIYFEAPVRHGLVYRVRGNMAGAVYVSITVETGPRDGTMGKGTAGVINDTMFDVGADGSFEITLGGPEQARNNYQPLTPRMPRRRRRRTTCAPCRSRSRWWAATSDRSRRRTTRRSRPASAAWRASSGRAPSACRRWRIASSPPSSRPRPTRSRSR